MLQKLREKTSGKIATVILGLLIIPFAFFGMESYMQQRVDTYVARISQPPSWWASAPSFWPVSMLWTTHDIESTEFRTRLETVRQRQRQEQGEAFDAKAFEDVENKREVLEQMIDEQVLLLNAEAAGIAIGDAQVRDTIQSLEQFQVNGKFDPQRYQLLLASQVPPTTPLEFQQRVREGLVQGLIPERLALSGLVTDAQLDRVLRLLGETRDVTYALLPLPAPDAAPVSDAQASQWYEANKSRYRQPETVRIEYVELRGDAIQVPPADDVLLRSRYEEQGAKYAEPEQRLVSHILVEVPADADEAARKAAEARANQIAAQARAAGADFAALARADSDDTGSKAAGGDLGWMGKGAMPGPFEDAVFAMAKGEIRGPLKTDFGWHVVQVRDVRAGSQQPFEAVREQLLAEYAETEHERLFNERSGQLVDEVMKSPATLAPAAQKLGLAVQTSQPFSRAGGEGITANPGVIDAAFSESLMQDGTASDPIEIAPNHNVLIRVIEHKPEQPLPLAQVRERVEADLRADRTSKAAAAAADALLADAGKGTLQQAASARTLPVQSVDAIDRTNPLPSPQAVEQFFRAARPEAGKSTLHKLALEDGRYLVFQVRAVRDGNPAEVPAEDRAQLRDQLARAAGVQATDAFIKAARRKYTINVAEDRL